MQQIVTFKKLGLVKQVEQLNKYQNCLGLIICTDLFVRGRAYLLACVFLSVYAYTCVDERECGVNDLSHEGRSSGSEAHSQCTLVGEGCPDLPLPVDLISVAVFRKRW